MSTASLYTATGNLLQIHPRAYRRNHPPALLQTAQQAAFFPSWCWLLVGAAVAGFAGGMLLQTAREMETFTFRTDS